MRGACAASWPLVAAAARLAPLARAGGHVRGCAAMLWSAAVVSLLDTPQLAALLPALLPPVLDAAEDASGKVPERVKETAAEALALLQRRAAPADFVEVARRVKEKKRERKRERQGQAALEAVADPELAARKRIAKNLGKRKGKKRKLERMKRARDAGGALGLKGRKRAKAGA